MGLDRAALTFFVGFTLCGAQTVNISGVVVARDGGDGIAGAHVSLENASVSTITGADGSFTLDGTAPIRGSAASSAERTPLVSCRNGQFEICLVGTTPVSLAAFDVNGRLVCRSRQTLNAGTHVLSSRVTTPGVHLYRIAIGHDVFTFKSTPFGALTKAASGSAGAAASRALGKQAAASAAMTHIILVTKEGQLDYRDSMTTTDTSGIVIEMIPNAGNMSDIDGNVYQTVQLGTQVWTVRNLRTTSYRNGTPIPHVTDGAAWGDLDSAAYCRRDNSTEPWEREKWGALYNWHAVNNARGLAPAGWHAPTEAEWMELENWLIANGCNHDGTTSVNKIAKSIAAKTDWATTIYGGVGDDLSSNNSSGFTALPTGYRGFRGGFSYQSYGCDWRSSTEHDATYAVTRGLSYRNDTLDKTNYNKVCGHSVRLVRD